MNIAEGTKRLYLAFTGLVLITIAVVAFEERPTKEKIEFRRIEMISAHYADQFNKLNATSFKTHDVRAAFPGDNAVVIEQLCDKAVGLLAAECVAYRDEIKGLRWAQVKHFGERVGYMGLAYIGLALFALLVSWVFHGFIAPKPGLPPQS